MSEECLYIKMMNVNNREQTVTLTRDGLCSEQGRGRREGYIQIGRDASLNDIVVADLEVARGHCQLKFEDGFSQRRIPNYFMQFLCLLKPSPSNSSPWQNLPLDLVQLIYSFLKKPRRFSIKDLGLGTEVCIPLEGLVLEANQVYSLGPQVLVRIHHINLVDSFTDPPPIHQCLWGTQNLHNNLKANPYVEIHINNNGQHSQVIVFATLVNSLATIGRFDSDIVIDNPSVSLTQCVLEYTIKDKKWRIKDGGNPIPSVNPTRLRLQKNGKSKATFYFKDKCSLIISRLFMRIRLGKRRL